MSTAREEASQPIRWPALPATPLVLVGRMDLGFMAERYVHLGPFTFEVERDRHGYKFAARLHGPRSRSAATVKVRLSKPRNAPHETRL